MEQERPAGQETPTTAQSLYRTWRSRDFAEVVGQIAVTKTLRNAVKSQSVGHAYLLTGPRGTGKTSTARILARAVNCLHPRDGEPCNACAPCLSQLEGRCLDVVEIDAASHNSVDDIRDLREKAPYAPTEVRRKVYIIDEVHMLSTSAFNALLKTLEEPPPHVMFVLATTDVYKVPATVSSRCQRLDFRVIDGDAIADRLAYVCEREGIRADAAALALLARQATGSLRDALSLLEQVRAYESESAIGLQEVERALGLARRDTLYTLSEAIMSGDLGGALTLIGDLVASGADMRHYSRQLVQHWRDLLLACAAGEGYASRQDADAHLAAQAATLATSDITATLKVLLQPDYSGRRSASAQWQLELAVAEACQHFMPDPSPRPRPALSAAPTPPPAAEPAARRTASTATEEPLVPARDAPRRAPVAEAVGGGAPGRDKAAGSDTAAPELDPWGQPAAPEGGAAPPEQRTPPPRAAAHEEQQAPLQAAALAEQHVPIGAAMDLAPLIQESTVEERRSSSMDERALWTALLKELPMTLGKMLETHCRLTSVIDGQAVIAVSAKAPSFERAQIERADKRVQIESVLGRLLGLVVVVRYAAMDGDSDASSPERIVETRGASVDRGARAAASAPPPPDTFKQDAERLLRGLYRGDGPRE